MDVITFKFYNVLINISRMGQITNLILVKSTGQKRVKRAYALSMIRFLSMAGQCFGQWGKTLQLQCHLSVAKTFLIKRWKREPCNNCFPSFVLYRHLIQTTPLWPTMEPFRKSDSFDAFEAGAEFLSMSPTSGLGFLTSYPLQPPGMTVDDVAREPQDNMYRIRPLMFTQPASPLASEANKKPKWGKYLLSSYTSGLVT